MSYQKVRGRPLLQKHHTSRLFPSALSIPIGDLRWAPQQDNMPPTAQCLSLAEDQ